MHASLKLSIAGVLTFALATPVFAQDARRPTTGGSTTGGSATSRGGSSSGGSTAGSSSTSGGTMSGGSSTVRGGAAVPRPSREPQATSRRPSTGATAGAGGSTVIPAYSRPRGDRVVRGEAVARGTVPMQPRFGTVFVPSYGFTSYYNYPFGFAYRPIYTGFGFFYYDPYLGYYDPYYGRGYYGYGASGGRYAARDDRDYDIGSLRLKISPREGEVYVDGLYRGLVDDFDGIFQRLKLEAGAHRLEVRAPGYETLVFDVLVTPGETTTYRGSLKR